MQIYVTKEGITLEQREPDCGVERCFLTKVMTIITMMRGAIIVLWLCVNLASANVFMPEAIRLLGHGAMVDSSSAWRGKWNDITGLIWLGGRY